MFVVRGVFNIFIASCLGGYGGPPGNEEIYSLDDFFGDKDCFEVTGSRLCSAFFRDFEKKRQRTVEDMSMESFIALGKECGLEGKELMAFVKEQQDDERKRLDNERLERQREREAKKLEAQEREGERQYRKREQEAERKLAMKQLELEQSSGGQGSVNVNSGAKLPKLPEFVNGKDDLDSYLQQFDRFAKRNQ